VRWRKFFADHLDGHPLIGESNGKPARWLLFRPVTNETWYHDNVRGHEKVPTGGQVVVPAGGGL
jgi:hypothetical protein